MIIIILFIAFCWILKTKKNDITSIPTNNKTPSITSINNIKPSPLPVSIKSINNHSLGNDMESMYDNKLIIPTKMGKTTKGEDSPAISVSSKICKNEGIIAMKNIHNFNNNTNNDNILLEYNDNDSYSDIDIITYNETPNNGYI